MAVRGGADLYKITAAIWDWNVNYPPFLHLSLEASFLGFPQLFVTGGRKPGDEATFSGRGFGIPTHHFQGTSDNTAYDIGVQQVRMIIW